MQFSYDTGTAGQPTYFRLYPTGNTITQKLGIGHGAEGPLIASGSSGPFYGVLLGDFITRANATDFNFKVASRGLPFEGKTANDENSTDSHQSLVVAASAMNRDQWVFDGAPWNGYSGSLRLGR
jgi:hypothetical protein